MSNVSASAPDWSDKAVERYRESVAPFQRNFWNKIDDLLDGDRGRIVVALFIIVCAGAVYLLAPSPREVAKDWAGWAFVIALVFVMFAVPTVRRWAVKPARWNRYSITDVQDIWDYIIPPEHPLRRTIAEQRVKHPEAEFEVEYLEPSPEEAGHVLPKYSILWMSPSPFTSTEKLPILVLKDHTTVVLPSA